MPTAMSASGVLHEALVNMQSVPVLSHYMRLLQQFHDLLSVAAPYTYSDDDCGRRLYDSTIQHRL